MPTPGIGPAGRRVAANVKWLRSRRELSLRDLEAKLRDLGRPILATGLLKLERSERRVDVDDLVALAEALEVSPERLLRTGEAASPVAAGEGGELVGILVKRGDRVETVAMSAHATATALNATVMIGDGANVEKAEDDVDGQR